MKYRQKQRFFLIQNFSDIKYKILKFFWFEAHDFTQFSKQITSKNYGFIIFKTVFAKNTWFYTFFTEYMTLYIFLYEEQPKTTVFLNNVSHKIHGFTPIFYKRQPKTTVFSHSKCFHKTYMILNIFWSEVHVFTQFFIQITFKNYGFLLFKLFYHKLHDFTRFLHKRHDFSLSSVKKMANCPHICRFCRTWK